MILLSSWLSLNLDTFLSCWSQACWQIFLAAPRESWRGWPVAVWWLWGRPWSFASTIVLESCRVAAFAYFLVRYWIRIYYTHRPAVEFFALSISAFSWSSRPMKSSFSSSFSLCLSYLIDSLMVEESLAAALTCSKYRLVVLRLMWTGDRSVDLYRQHYLTKVIFKLFHSFSFSFRQTIKKRSKSLFDSSQKDLNSSRLSLKSSGAGLYSVEGQQSPICG